MSHAIKSSWFVRSLYERRLSIFGTALTLATFWCLFVFEPALKDGARSDFHLRFWGMFLQIFGAVTVLYDLYGALREFGELTLFQKVLDRTYNLLTRPQPVSIAIGWTEGADIIAATIVAEPPKPLRPLKIRIAQWRRAREAALIELRRLQVAVNQQESQSADELKLGVEKLNQRIENVQDQLKRVMTGNHASLQFGGACLLVGIVLTSIPAEIADCLAPWNLMGWFESIFGQLTGRVRMFLS